LIFSTDSQKKTGIKIGFGPIYRNP